MTRHDPNRIMRMLIRTAISLAVVLSLCSVAQAGGIGHYAPAVPNILDFFQPESGLYYVQYSPYYNTDSFKGAGGSSVSSITIHPGPGPGVPVAIDANLHAISLIPTFIWVTPWKILGAQIGAFMMPTVSNINISAALSGEILGNQASLDQANYAWGDMYFQPIWLDWAFKHFDVEFGEGFWAPVGKYSTNQVNVGPFTVTAPSASNVGLGYWTNQMQVGTAWYPFDNKGTAAAAALTWEINSKMQNIDLVQGQRLVLNWGVNQFLPVTKDESRLISVGVTGYDNLQVTGDSGSAGSDSRSQVHAVGGQAGFAIVPSNFAFNVRYLHEYAARSTFMGDWVSLSFAIKAF
ncbi:MAG TPA: transporter [Nitrospiria bacterium]|nr:transporter [Nitrospiria bacterium]